MAQHSWEAAKRIVQAADRLAEASKADRVLALKASSRILDPLQDPLTLNWDRHRWLYSDREESYSDWLAWLLQQIENGREILTILGVECTLCGREAAEITREEVFDDGRCDIVVRTGQGALVVVEVKIRPINDNVHEQLERYRWWAKEQPARAKKATVLLAVEEPEELAQQYRFLSWEQLCRNLRNAALRRIHSRPLLAAVMLGFCGAAECNLLEMTDKAHTRSSAQYVSTWRSR